VLDGHVLDSAHNLFPSSIEVSDLNKDGYSDLVILFGGFLRAGVRSGVGEVWIYEGGPNFQVDSPTVVLRDTEENDDRLYLAIHDFDGDSLPDLLLSGLYIIEGASKLKTFWGKPSLQQLSSTPDHAITFDYSSNDPHPIGIPLTIADLDGDQIADFMGTILTGINRGVYCFLSSSKKDFRGRRLTISDADRYLLAPENFHSRQSVGALGDSSGRYSMLTLYGSTPSIEGMILTLSANSQGPIDGKYDAYYGASLDGLSSGGVFGRGGPAGDVNGDGWSDYLTANPGWFGNDAGIAMILAGGPYIPRDDNTTSVQDIPAEGKENALAVWPNPVREVLNIAWRGDLQRMPQRFEIHTFSGERVAGGTVESSIGAAVWHCDEVATGSYVLTAYDAKNQAIATATIIKQ
ncbi:MAG: hypothetical protein IT211_12295, partial [Armatimonadetes bacterium]|nr:hypothetical protein [Armatimonadota bacterium]